MYIRQGDKYVAAVPPRTLGQQFLERREKTQREYRDQHYSRLCTCAACTSYSQATRGTFALVPPQPFTVRPQAVLRGRVLHNFRRGVRTNLFHDMGQGIDGVATVFLNTWWKKTWWKKTWWKTRYQKLKSYQSTSMINSLLYGP